MNMCNNLQRKTVILPHFYKSLYWLVYCATNATHLIPMSACALLCMVDSVVLLSN